MLPQEIKQVDAEYVHGLRLVTIQRNTCQGPAARPLDPPANARSTLRHTSRLCSMCVIWFRSRIDSSHSLATLRVSIPATRPLRPAPYFVTKLVPSFASRSRSPSMQESPQTKQAMLASSVCFLQPRHDECKHSRTRKTSRRDNEPHAVLPLSRRKRDVRIRHCSVFSAITHSRFSNTPRCVTGLCKVPPLARRH